MSSQSWHADLADVRQPVDRPIENVGSIPVGGRIVPQRGEAPVECAIDPPLADSLAHAKMKHPERAERFGLPSEGQRHRVAGLNLLVTVVIFWNTFPPGEAVSRRKHASLTVGPELVAHISPLGWACILLTGEYWGPKRRWRPWLAILPPNGATPRSLLANGPARDAATRECASLELWQPSAGLGIDS